MKNTAPATTAIAASLAFVTATALAAVWTGGDSGILDNAANWDGNPATSTMVFTNDCTLTLSGDATIYQPLTDGIDVPSAIMNNAKKYHSVTFDLNGHTLWATNNYFTNNKFSDAQYWRCLGMSATFTGGGTLRVVSGSMTNAVAADNANNHSLSLTFTGAGTRFVGSWASRIPTENYPGARFRLLDGAEARGNYFHFAGFNTTNEVSGGARLLYSAHSSSIQSGTSSGNGWFTGVCVGGQLTSFKNAVRGDVLKVSGEGTVVEPIAPGTANGLFFVGYGGTAAANGGNRVVVEDGATLVLPRYTAVGHGGVEANMDYHSNSNELVVTGAGSTLVNNMSNTDFPTAVGRRGSFNRLLIDNGAFAKLKAVSSGGEVKYALQNDNTGLISSYVSAYNSVRVDHGATLDAYAVLVGNQHTDFKKVVAQYGGQCYSNRVDIVGGSTLYATNSTSTVGAIAPYFGNVLSISGAGTTAKFGNPSTGTAIHVGQAGSCFNRFEVLDGATVETGNCNISCGGSSWGYAPDGTTVVRGIGNMVRIEGAGSSITGLVPDKSLILGSETNGNANVLWVGDGAALTWPGYLTISGFDNSVVVSNGTFTLARNLCSVWGSTTTEISGRTRFVFAGAAPKLVSTSTGISKFVNGAILRFEVPAAGWAEAPLQMTGASNNVQFDEDTKLEVDVATFAKQGGGEIPVVTTGRKLNISNALLESWNAALAPQEASVRLSDDGKTLYLKARSKKPTLLLIQ